MAAKEQRETINRLRSIRPLRATVDGIYVKSIEATQAGKPVVWPMVNLHYGDPILKAMDIEVVCPENYGAMATVTGVAQQYLDRADAEGLPTGPCG